MSIQSLHRAFDIMELIASHTSPVPLKTIAEEMGLSVSTVHNLVQTMVSRGFIQHIGPRGGFTLGYELVELAAAVPVHLHNTEIIKPYVLDLYERSEKESSYFSILRKDTISTEIYLPSSYALSVSLGVDSFDKLHSSAQGKVFLAYMSDSHLDKYLRMHELAALGPNTITDEAKLRSALAQVRKQGYAENNEESELGACGLAAPILNHDGHILGALALGLPSVRMQQKRDMLIQLLLELSGEIHAKLSVESQSV